MRLIDADVLMKQLQDFCDWCKDGRKQGADFCLDCMIPNAPTIEPMPEYIDNDLVVWHYANGMVAMNERAYQRLQLGHADIVRCKDCNFNYANEHNCEYNPEDIVCTYWASDGLRADDFCSYGVRKTNTIAEEKPTPIRDYMVHGERKE